MRSTLRWLASGTVILAVGCGASVSQEKRTPAVEAATAPASALRTAIGTASAAPTRLGAAATPAPVLVDNCWLPAHQSPTRPTGSTPPLPAATPEREVLPEHVSTSLDGIWATKALSGAVTGAATYRTELPEWSMDRVATWTVVNEHANMGHGHTMPKPMQCSQDGPYFYRTDAPVPDGCGVLTNGSSLWRADLAAG